MNEPDSANTVAGICHARGPNAELPAQWLIYINVANLADSLEQCSQRGGKVLHGPRDMGSGSCAVVQDPAGAVAALDEAKRTAEGAMSVTKEKDDLAGAASIAPEEEAAPEQSAAEPEPPGTTIPTVEFESTSEDDSAAPADEEPDDEPATDDDER